MSKSTPLAHFRSNGYAYDCGIYISKVPADLSLGEFLSNPIYYSHMRMWSSHSPQVTFSQFNSDTGPLELRWNGMYQEWNKSTGEYDLCMANSGYYFILPKLYVTEGNYASCDIDRNSIFYLDSLNVSMSFSFDDRTNNLTVGLSLSNFGQGITNGTLKSQFRYDDVLEEQPYSNLTLRAGVTKYQNRTFDLSNDDSWSGSFTTRMPFYPSSGFFFEGQVMTEKGRYTFGVMASVMNGNSIFYVFR